jgi:signal transduction histidine kinase
MARRSSKATRTSETETQLRAEIARLKQRLHEAERVVESMRAVPSTGSNTNGAAAPLEADSLAISILEQAAEPILVLNDFDEVIHASRQAIVLAGQDPVGKPFDDVFSLEMPSGDSQSIGGHIIGRDAIFRRADDRTFYLLYSRSPLLGEDGTSSGSVIVLADISRTKQVEEQLRRSREDLQRLNDNLEERVAQRTRALSRANIALIQKNRELQDFAYVASHDLQEPLRKISSFVDLFMDEFGEEVSDDGHGYLCRIRDSALRMSELLRGLLSFSRVLTEARPFHMIDLSMVIEGVLADLQILIEETGTVVETRLLPSIEADETQMRQLFQNLIQNAIKFARPDEPPRVRIKAKMVEAASDVPGEMMCRIEVADNGIGFHEKYLDRIFTPFQRLHGRSAYPGTGMGLAICRRIVERHHGELTATSAPGEGSCFVIKLPVVQFSRDSEEDDRS